MALEWSAVVPSGIQRDDAATLWHAGRVTAVLPLPDGGVLAGTPGGLWNIRTTGEATRVNLDAWSGGSSDEDRTLLAMGPDGPAQIFLSTPLTVGKPQLWVTNVSSKHPLDDAWIPIDVPNGWGIVDSMLVLPGSRRIVITSNTGLWWAPIPARGMGKFTWTQADSTACAGLAEAPNQTIIVVKTGQGLFSGQWTQPTQLQLQGPASISGFDNTNTGPAAAGSSLDRTVLYVAVGDNMPAARDVTFYALLSSTDGGRTWAMVPSPTVTNVTVPPTDLHSVAGNYGGNNRCLAVSTLQPQTVALGWTNGLFLSTDGGSTWTQHIAGTPSDWNLPAQDLDEALHVDLHALYFARWRSTRGWLERLHVASDGGLVATGDLGTTFDSSYNQNLINLQMNHSSVHGSAVASAQQDNGVTYCDLRSPAPAWRSVDPGGDGRLALFVATGDLVYKMAGSVIVAARWSGGRLSFSGRVPVWSPDSQWQWPRVMVVNANGLTGGAVYQPVVDIVPRPKRFSAVSGTPILGVAAEGNTLYGLFRNWPCDPASGFRWLTCWLASWLGSLLGWPDPNDMHWEPLATLSLPTGATISAVGSYDGDVILAGTSDGQIFWLSPGIMPSPMPITGNDPRYPAILDLKVNAASAPELDGFALVQSNVLALVGGSTQDGRGQWAPTPGRPTAGDGSQPNLYHLTAAWPHPTRPRGASVTQLAVASVNSLYLSWDLGTSWNDVSSGIPPAAFYAVQFAQGSLYATTYGSSLWSAPASSGPQP